MKRFISSVLALGMCLIPLSVTLIIQPSWAQSQDLQVEKLRQFQFQIFLLEQQARQQIQLGQPRQAIETFQQILAIARQFQDRKEEARALLGLGLNYDSISEHQQALTAFNQALHIYKELGERTREAGTLIIIGEVYNRISQPQEALKYYNQALPILRELGDRAGEAATLTKIDAVQKSSKPPSRSNI